jgi:hypothetical protein
MNGKTDQTLHTLAHTADTDGMLLLQRLQVEVAQSDVFLGTATDYSYTLTVTPIDPGPGAVTVMATVSATSIYGAMYALETFAQLVEFVAFSDHRGGVAAVLSHSSIRVVDAPDHVWRGLLVDTGRRFAPISLLENILETMAAVKLNVLHLHLTDFCRFAVESKAFPLLTAGLAPGSPNAGYVS